MLVMQDLCERPDEVMNRLLPDEHFMPFESMQHCDKWYADVVQTEVRRDDWFGGYNLDWDSVDALMKEDAPPGESPALALFLPSGFCIQNLDEEMMTCGSPLDFALNTSGSSGSVSTQCSSSDARNIRKDRKQYAPRKRKFVPDEPTKSGEDLLEDTVKNELSKATPGNSSILPGTMEQIANVRMSHPKGLLVEDFVETFKEVKGSSEFWDYVKTIAIEQPLASSRTQCKRNIIVWK